MIDKLLKCNGINCVLKYLCKRYMENPVNKKVEVIQEEYTMKKNYCPNLVKIEWLNDD